MGKASEWQPEPTRQDDDGRWEAPLGEIVLGNYGKGNMNNIF